MQNKFIGLKGVEMFVKASELKIGEYYQIGDPMIGILKLKQTDINAVRALVHGDFMDIKSGGITDGTFRLNKVKAVMPSERVWYYCRQFAIWILNF